MSRRAGDYALCGLGITVTLDEDLRVSVVRAAYISVGPTPTLVDLTDAVGGQVYDAADWSSAGALAVAAVSPEEDIHATADYRRELVRVLTIRGGRSAVEQVVEALVTEPTASEDGRAARSRSLASAPAPAIGPSGPAILTRCRLGHEGLHHLLDG